MISSACRDTRATRMGFHLIMSEKSMTSRRRGRGGSRPARITGGSPVCSAALVITGFSSHETVVGHDERCLYAITLNDGVKSPLGLSVKGIVMAPSAPDLFMRDDKFASGLSTETTCLSSYTLHGGRRRHACAGHRYSRQPGAHYATLNNTTPIKTFMNVYSPR